LSWSPQRKEIERINIIQIMVYYNEEIMEWCRWLKKVKIKRKVELIDFEKMTKEYLEEKIFNDSYAILRVFGMKSGIANSGPAVCFGNSKFMKNAEYGPF
jgi:hypothetical protein